MIVTRLIVTADVHGSYTTWLTLKSLLRPDDTLVVAGDLFDTRYGRPGRFDFQPEAIKEELANLGNPFFYVYGNCDVPTFFPGHAFELEFSHMETKILLVHGHALVSRIPVGTSMIIQGHTHIPKLEQQENLVLFNPGSLTSPRTKIHTYGIMENKVASIIDIQNNRTLISLDLCR